MESSIAPAKITTPSQLHENRDNNHKRKARKRLAKAGNDTVDYNYFALQGTFFECYFLQSEQLKQLDKNATLILNVQTADNWYDQNIKRGGHGNLGLVPLDVQMSRCFTGTKYAKFQNNLRGATKAWHLYQINTIKRLVADSSNHPTLVEIDVDSDTAGENLFQAFYGEKALENQLMLQHVHHCWKRAVARSRQSFETSKDDQEFLKYKKQERDKLLLPAPIVAVGLPKAGTTSIYGFFKCHGLHASHNHCHADIYGRI